MNPPESSIPAASASGSRGEAPIRPVAGSDWTTRRLIRWMGERFAAAGLDHPRLVGEMLLAHVLECERMRLYMEADRPASPDELTRLRALVRRAAEGEPVQLLVGTAHFFGREFLVDGSTLIPQPCTEVLVERVIRFLQPQRTSVFDRFDLARLDGLLEGTLVDGELEAAAESTAEATVESTAEATPGDAVDEAASEPRFRVADIGTGSGCVAISIALGVPGVRVHATDIAEEALALAARNIERFGVGDRVRLIQGDGCRPLAERLAAEGPWDAIVSNPPYIPDAEWTGGQVEEAVRRHVPERALRGGPDGLSVLKPLLREAPQLLRPGGLLVLECAAAHAEQLRQWAEMHPRLTAVELLDDEDGLPRTLVARRPA